MAIDSLHGIASAGSRSADTLDRDLPDVIRTATAAVRVLNGRNIPDREFSIVRDPQSQRFIIQVLDRNTREVIDQFPPEEILKLLTQLKQTQTETEQQ